MQGAVEEIQAVHLFLFVQVGTQAGIGLGQIVQTLGQGAEIHHRAADNQRTFPTRRDFADQTRAVFDKTGGTVCLNGRNDIDKVVRDKGTLGMRRFRRADVHTGIDQCGIEADDFDR